MKYGYARISTLDQNADMQLKALERAGVEPKNIFKDELSGATTKRGDLVAGGASWAIMRLWLRRYSKSR
jgi:DNA invertase Pin-like site-specific DNA recombinase